MKIKIDLMYWLLIFTACSSSASPPSLEKPRVGSTAKHPGTTMGRAYVKQLYARDMAALHAQFSDQMMDAVPEVALRTQIGAALDQLGPEHSLITETTRELGELWLYRRVVRFKNSSDPFEIQFSFRRKGTIEGFFLKKVDMVAMTDFDDYRNRTRLGLPFSGTWNVVWGGRTVSQNRHAAHANQKYAYDFLIIKDGKTHRTNGRNNYDYHCFGEAILAPARGVVVDAFDGIADNVPGRLNPEQLVGNYVVIDHGNQEFSMLAHLQNQSIWVQKGDEVEAGTLIGLCGNSGNSSEPHLHYQLQNSPVLGSAACLPAAFNDFAINGALAPRPTEPQQGQIIESSAPLGAQGTWMLSFRNVPLATVLRIYTEANILNKPLVSRAYLADKRVTFSWNRKLDASEARQLLGAGLAVHGWITEDRGASIWVRERDETQP